jgi:pimeloyl-ACP methyl ester carboxylesterase
MWVIILALSLAALYVAIRAGMYFAQTWFIFPAVLSRATRVHLPESAQRLKVRTPDGENLIGVRIPGTRAKTDGSASLLGFAGNAWNAETMVLILHRLFPDRSVIGFHYRGYRPSSGRPSPEALLSDSLVVFDHLGQTQAPQPVVAVGFSIGSGIAAYLARHRPVEGLILVTPFDSLEVLARELYWWAPVGPLFRHRMSTIDLVRASLVPTALFIAEHDTVVPKRRSEPLRAAIRNLMFEREIDAKHNDIYDRPAFAVAMQEALMRIEAA